MSGRPIRVSDIFGNLEPRAIVPLNVIVTVTVCRSVHPELVMVVTTTGSKWGLGTTTDMTPDAALEYAAALVQVATAIKATHP